MKTVKTRTLEQLLYKNFNARNDFFVFETTIGWYGKEIVDCIMYNCQREISCYEIKSSKQDFNSKSAKTFIGNKNYYVMPLDLYNELKNDIPYEVGCYVAVKRVEYGDNQYQVGYEQLVCIKHAKKQELKADKEIILSSMLRSMQRDRVMNFEDLEVLNE